MRLHEIKPLKKFKRNRQRVGRGSGSGMGKTCGRGHKGSLARTGGTKNPGFEGGQMPLIRRLPKRGFNNKRFGTQWQIVNIEDLECFDANATIDRDMLFKKKMIKKQVLPLKILGKGALTKPLTVKAHGFSKSAAEKIAATGGKAELVKQ